MHASIVDDMGIDEPGHGLPVPLRCECPTCGREGCSGDCDWSGPPEDDSGDWAPVPPPDIDDDDDDDTPSPPDDSEDGDTTSSSSGDTYEDRVMQAILGVMDGEEE